MNVFGKNKPRDGEVARSASEWTIRIDRGLTASEQDAYTQWLAEHPRHREAVAESRWGWDELDRLAGLQTTRHARMDPDLLRPSRAEWTKLMGRRSRWLRWAPVPIALAAGLAVALLWVQIPEGREESQGNHEWTTELPPRIEMAKLADGSSVHLNRGARIKAIFNEQERRVHLLEGEANFQVAHEPTRPFIVDAAGVEVRAVGTAFNVRKTPEAVDVIVTKGKVRIGTGPSQAREGSAPPLFEPGSRVIVALESSPDRRLVEVSTLGAAAMERELIWQPRLLDFDAAPLPEIIEAFNRANPVTLVVGDPALENLVLSSAFWSDNVEGFVRLMESSFSLRAQRRGVDEIVLYPAPGTR